MSKNFPRNQEVEVALQRAVDLSRRGGDESDVAQKFNLALNTCDDGYGPNDPIRHVHRGEIFLGMGRDATKRLIRTSANILKGSGDKDDETQARLSAAAQTSITSSHDEFTNAAAFYTGRDRSHPLRSLTRTRLSAAFSAYGDLEVARAIALPFNSLNPSWSLSRAIADYKRAGNLLGDPPLDCAAAALNLGRLARVYRLNGNDSLWKSTVEHAAAVAVRDATSLQSPSDTPNLG